MIAICGHAHRNCISVVAAYAMVEASRSGTLPSPSIEVPKLELVLQKFEDGPKEFFFEKPKRTYPKIPPKRLR